MRLFSSLLLLACVVGCSSASESSLDEPSEGEGELRRTEAAQKLAKAVAVEMDVTPLPRGSGSAVSATIGVAATVARIVNLRKTSESSSGEAACTGHKANLRFFDADAKQIGKSQIVCGVGVLDLPDTATIGIKTDVDMLEIARAERVPADALWGISEIEVTKFQGATTKVNDAAELKKLVAAIDGTQKIDSTAPIARCPPKTTVSFKRGGTTVAYAGLPCSELTEETSVHARFTIVNAADDDADPIASGRISLDPRPFMTHVR